jgi:hypothetical protein
VALANLFPLAILPENGLDRSLHAPVLAGLVLVTFFAEAFGWTYAGLVVPGYLAATFAAAPATGILMLVEATLTHFAVATLALHIPARTGAWSTAFGRERFFLYIVVAVIVRLWVEGALVPWFATHTDLPHSRELYSIGLVLVPLIANVFWASGLKHTLPRLMVMVGLTWLFVEFVLLRWTNFSLSRFQVANESVALRFLDTPKAYLLILTGAMLGARGNVEYGWDYNGILVPALLAVAWYEPFKLLGTMVEALVVYLLARYLAESPLFARVPLVGPRRMVFVAFIGFFVKLVAGHVLARYAPHVQVIDFLGFGYILPSLLAVKMWNKLRIGIVLMPTLQVSLTAFLLGNALAFGLDYASRLRLPAAAPGAEFVATRQPGFELFLASSEPPPRPGECPVPTQAAAFAEALYRTRVGTELTAGSARAIATAGVGRWMDSRSGWRVFAPRDGQGAPCAPWRAAVRPRTNGSLDRVLVVYEPAPASPLAVAAVPLAELLGADLSVLISPEAGLGARDRELVYQLSDRLSPVEVALSEDGVERLVARGALPAGFDVQGLGLALGTQLTLAWEAPVAPGAGPRLVLSRATVERIAAQTLGAPPLQRWPEAVRRGLVERSDTLVRHLYRAPRVGELRALSAVVAPALERYSEPSPWERAVSAQLGYAIALLGSAEESVWVLHEPTSETRRGNATWVVRRGAASPIAVEVPAPLWEIGTLSTGLALFEGERARHLVFSGAHPDSMPDGSADVRRPEGRFAYFQRIHEWVLATNARVIAVHGAAPDTVMDREITIGTGFAVLDPEHVPPWLEAVRAGLADAGIETAYYRGRVSEVELAAQQDPAFAFAERFARDHMARLWLSQALRRRVPRVPPTGEVAVRLGVESHGERDIATYALELAACEGANCSSAGMTPTCDLDRAVRQLELWVDQRNPFDRRAAVALGRGCSVETVTDARSGMPWGVLASGSQVRLVPLHGPSGEGRRTPPLKQLAAVRRAVAFATATVVVEGD